MGLGGTANPLMAQNQLRSDLSIWLKPHSGNIPASRENATMKLEDLRGEKYVLLEGKLKP